MVSLGGDGKWLVWDSIKPFPHKEIKQYMSMFEFAKPPTALSASALKKGRKQEELFGYIAISPDTQITAVVQKYLIRLFRTADGSLLEMIESTEFGEHTQFGLTILETLNEIITIRVLSKLGIFFHKFKTLWLRHSSQRQLLPFPKSFAF